MLCSLQIGPLIVPPKACQAERVQQEEHWAIVVQELVSSSQRLYWQIIQPETHPRLYVQECVDCSQFKKSLRIILNILEKSLINYGFWTAIYG